jgi:serine/threonine protein kinase
MDKHSDLILDSKLNTRFESVFTVHSYREVSHNAERRVVVQREEYWRQIEHIGSGAYGSVWLEKCVQYHRDGALRAIKKVSTRPSRSGREKDYSQELKAVAKFSHDKVSTKSHLDWC